MRKYPNIHEPNNPAKGGGKGVQDIHGRGDPRHESIAAAVLGLIEHGILFTEDCQDIFRGITGLKPGKERMFGEVLLSLAVVFFQRSVEYGGKVGMGGGHGRDSGHGVTSQ